jgi:hypothetical protein
VSCGALTEADGCGSYWIEVSQCAELPAASVAVKACGVAPQATATDVGGAVSDCTAQLSLAVAAKLPGIDAVAPVEQAWIAVGQVIFGGWQSLTVTASVAVIGPLPDASEPLQ